MKVITTNRKASFSYHLMDRIEAGLSLLGSEVRSLREGGANLTDSFATIKNGEVWLLNAHIAPYEPANYLNHKPTRERKLLLHKREIIKLTVKLKEKGLTLVPTKLYFKDGRAKVEIALAKGKRLYDKREAIKKREAGRAIQKLRS